MTPAARSQAAVELLDAIIVAARDAGAAADTLIARYFAQRRYAGSKDRRAVRELVFRAVRRAGEVPASGRAALVGLADEDAALAATFDGSPRGPAPIAADEPRATAATAPDWLVAALAASGVDEDVRRALVNRAPLDLRVNTLRADRETVAALFPDAAPTPLSPLGLRLPPGTAIETMPAWRDGLVEVQDEGSQIIGLGVAARPGERVVDLCAGAGGKTLMLAAAMENRGALLACDTDRGRLARLRPRAERAGASMIDARLLDPGRETAALADWTGQADAVLVDAPCSGTGTWRRNPEARWRLTTNRLARLSATQRHVLGLGAALVRPGAVLVYAVCSLLDAEGRDQVDAFLAERPGWAGEPLPVAAGRACGAGWRLDPARDGTDGFFLARLRAPC